MNWHSHEYNRGTAQKDIVQYSVLGVMRYLCNALRNIITFVVPK